MNKKTNYIVKCGALAAIAFVLQLLGSIIGLKVSGFLEIEISDLPALIGAFALGPLCGVLIELVKNILHCAVTSTGFVGELANFFVNGVFVLTAGLIYKKKRTRRGALIGMLCAVVTMTAAAIASNLFIMLPMYMPNADFSARLTLVLSIITPFNLCRGTALAAITFFVYKKLSPILKK